MMRGWLKALYKDGGSSLPELLIVYRDGVGQGQIKNIIDVELPALHKTIASVAKEKLPGYNPGIAFILANKNVPQRIFDW